MALFGGHMLALMRERGQLDDIEAGLQYFVQTFLEKYPAWSAMLRASVALLDFGCGREQEARRAFEVLAAKDFTDLPRDEHWLTTLGFLTDVCSLLGDRRRAAQLYALLLPFAERPMIHDLHRTSSGSVSHYLGLLAAVAGDADQAARHFEDALRMNERWGARPALARTQYEYASFVFERGRRGDRTKALALLDQCLKTADELGMTLLHTDAVELGRRMTEISPDARSLRKP